MRNRNWKKYLTGILAAALCLGGTAIPAAAEGELSVAIPVKVEQEGHLEADAPDTVQIVLEASDASNPMPEGAEAGQYKIPVETAGEKEFAFSFDQVGIYEYTVKQEPGTSGHCTYDSREYALKVQVINGADGGFESVVALRESGKEDKVDICSFKNVYEYDTDRIDPPIEKVIQDDSGDAPADSEFRFRMTPGSPDQPMPDPAECEYPSTIDETTGAMTITKKGAGPAEFGWITFGAADVGKTYTYTLEELQGTDENYDYDTAKYTVKVDVVLEDGNVRAKETILDDSEAEVTKGTFTNRYLPTESGDVVTYAKLIKVDADDAEEMLEGAVFTFHKKDGTKIGGSYTTDENGEILIKSLAAGEYYFLETKAPAGYQKISEKQTVTVTDQNTSESKAARITVENTKKDEEEEEEEKKDEKGSKKKTVTPAPKKKTTPSRVARAVASVKKAVKTGDAAHVIAYGIVLAAALVLLGVLVGRRRRNR